VAKPLHINVAPALVAAPGEKCMLLRLLPKKEALV
jgi:hypothetical protein